MIRRYASATFLAAALALTAAAGVSTIEPREADAQTTSSTVSVAGCTGTTITLTTAEKRSLDLHNQTRASNGLTKFCVHPVLQKAARAHSLDMINKDFFSHTSPGGETFSARLKRFGYTPVAGRYWAVGENIAYNSSTGTALADKAHSRWMNSTGHKANILNKNYKQIGVGAVHGDYKGFKVTMWTADFGTR